MKEPWDWDEADVLRLIADQVQEGLTIEYKECDALQKSEGKKTEISKDVSAFANSAGGAIVYGMKENRHVPTEIDVGFDPNDISKEWLEQVINSRIHRRIDGVRINQVQLSGPKAGKVVYAVSVPQSVRAPHMASDKRFYKRFNFESVPMEEYEVRDVSRRLVAPDLHLAVRLPELGAPLQVTSGLSQSFAIEILVDNSSPAPADFALISFYIDAGMNASCHRGSNPDNAVDYMGKSIPVCSHVIEWRGSLRLPIWKGSRFRLTATSVSLPANGHQCYVFWQIQAPMMNRKQGITALQISDKRAVISDAQGAWKLQKDVTVGV